MSITHSLTIRNSVSRKFFDKWSITNQTLGFYQQAGAFAAIVVDFVVYPFDTLKTRIQSPDYNKVFKDAQTGALKRNVLFKGLYQGVWSVVFSTIPSCMHPFPHRTTLD